MKRNTLGLWAAAAFLLLPLTAEARTLRWAADTESGAPFVFQDPKNPDRLLGFEKDIIDALARELGEKTRFVQNSWDGLVPGLQRNLYDMIINGVEITEERKAEIHFSDPYFITSEQLTVRATQTGIESLADLKGKKAGTLGFSLAERILQQAGGIEVVAYEEETNAYADLKNGRVDAVLLDAPIAQYYAAPDTALKAVGAPIGEVFYGIGIRKSDGALLEQVNKALGRIRASGELREIYDRWNLWNPLMAGYFQDFSASRTPPSAYTRFLKNTGQDRSLGDRLKLYGSFLPVLAKGAVTTLELSIAGMAIAVAFGLLLALARLYGPKPVSWAAVAYIELTRGTPLLIQLFFIFYALPHIGIKLSPFVAAVMGLGLNYAACEAENYRGGIQGIPKGQSEAAHALGLSTWQTLRHVLLPQALKSVMPPITNDFIALLKDSSLVSVITMVELTKIYGQLASTYYDFLGTGLLVACVYLLLGLPFVRLARMLERRLHAPGAGSGSGNGPRRLWRPRPLTNQPS